MCNLKNNKISDGVLMSNIKNCFCIFFFFFLLSAVNPHHLKIQPTQDQKYSGKKKFEKVPKRKTWIGLKLATISKVFTLYLELFTKCLYCIRQCKLSRDDWKYREDVLREIWASVDFVSMECWGIFEPVLCGCQGMIIWRYFSDSH